MNIFILTLILCLIGGIISLRNLRCCLNNENFKLKHLILGVNSLLGLGLFASFIIVLLISNKTIIEINETISKIDFILFYEYIISIIFALTIVNTIKIDKKENKAFK